MEWPSVGFKVLCLTNDACASLGIGVSAISIVGITSEIAQVKLKPGPVEIKLSVGL